MNFNLTDLGNLIQNFLVETSCLQLVKGFTRSEVVRGRKVARSCIDHCYTNAPDKVSAPELVTVGNSDHLGIYIRKQVKHISSKPNTVMKRSYKDFIIEDFLKDVLDSDMDNIVTGCKDLEMAAHTFEAIFKNVGRRKAEWGQVG